MLNWDGRMQQIILDYKSLPKFNPAKTLQTILETMGWEQKDLTCYLGSEASVSLVCRGKKHLSLQQIAELNTSLGIPFDYLIDSNQVLKQKAKK